eukprot:Ihof_evm1s327 gene=Ihof_evmTU1s327
MAQQWATNYGGPQLQLSPAEQSFNESLYARVAPNLSGSVTNEIVISILRLTNIPQNVLGKIWQQVDTGRGKLDRNEFFIVLKLVSLAQNAQEPTIQNIGMSTPPAYIEGIQAPSPQAQANAMQAPSVTSKQAPPQIRRPVSSPNPVRSGTVEWLISPQEKATYDQYFQSLQLVQDRAPASVVREYLLQSGLPSATLGQIWNLTDITQVGSLNDEEFAVAMYLIQGVGQGRRVPDQLPAELVPPSARARAPQQQQTPEAFSPLTRSFTSTEGIQPALPPLGQPLGQSLGQSITQQTASGTLPFFSQSMSSLNPNLANNNAGQPQPGSIPGSPRTSMIFGAPQEASNGSIPPSPFFTPMHQRSGSLGMSQSSGSSAASRHSSATHVVSRNTPAPPPPVPHHPQQQQQQQHPNANGNSVPFPLPTAAAQQQAQVETGWVVPTMEKISYDQIFAQCDKDQDGIVGGQDVAPIFQQSKLPNALLAQIWNLVDFQQKGQLDADQFALAMFLIKLRVKGSLDPVPSSLTIEYIPPSWRTELNTPPPVPIQAQAIPQPQPPVPVPLALLGEPLGTSITQSSTDSGSLLPRPSVPNANGPGPGWHKSASLGSSDLHSISSNSSASLQGGLKPQAIPQSPTQWPPMSGRGSSKSNLSMNKLSTMTPTGRLMAMQRSAEEAKKLETLHDLGEKKVVAEGALRDLNVTMEQHQIETSETEQKIHVLQEELAVIRRSKELQQQHVAHAEIHLEGLREHKQRIVEEVEKEQAEVALLQQSVDELNRQIELENAEVQRLTQLMENVRLQREQLELYQKDRVEVKAVASSAVKKAAEEAELAREAQMATQEPANTQEMGEVFSANSSSTTIPMTTRPGSLPRLDAVNGETSSSSSLGMVLELTPNKSAVLGPKSKTALTRSKSADIFKDEAVQPETKVMAGQSTDVKLKNKKVIRDYSALMDIDREFNATPSNPSEPTFLAIGKAQSIPSSQGPPTQDKSLVVASRCSSAPLPPTAESPMYSPALSPQNEKVVKDVEPMKNPFDESPFSNAIAVIEPALGDGEDPFKEDLDPFQTEDPFKEEDGFEDAVYTDKSNGTDSDDPFGAAFTFPPAGAVTTASTSDPFAAPQAFGGSKATSDPFGSDPFTNPFGPTSETKGFDAFSATPMSPKAGHSKVNDIFSSPFEVTATTGQGNDDPFGSFSQPVETPISPTTTKRLSTLNFELGEENHTPSDITSTTSHATGPPPKEPESSTVETDSADVFPSVQGLKQSSSVPGRQPNASSTTNRRSLSKSLLGSPSGKSLTKKPTSPPTVKKSFMNTGVAGSFKGKTNKWTSALLSKAHGYSSTEKEKKPVVNDSLDQSESSKPKSKDLTILSEEDQMKVVLEESMTDITPEE